MSLSLALDLSLGSRASGGGGPAAPVNTVAPSLTGDTTQGGTIEIVAGTWTGATSYRYKIVKGDAIAPTSPEVVYLDWTTSTSTPVSGISDGDYLWVKEEATGAGGVTVATATTGFGPMSSIPAADASIIGAGGYNSAANTAATAYSFTMDISNVTRRGLLLSLHAQYSSGATDPSFNSVTIEGIPLTLVTSYVFADTATRTTRTEIWALWGNDVPTGTGLTVSYTRSASTNSTRTTASAIAIGNTQIAAPASGDVTQSTSVTDAAGYTFSVSTAVAKRLCIAFVNGQWTTFTGTNVFTAGTGWTKELDLWPGTRATSSLAWGAVQSKAVATASTFNADYTITESGGSNQRYGILTMVRVAGDNS
jgi:hypothetical protein